jgi:hypothetical protein
MKYDYWHGPDDIDRRVKYAEEFNANPAIARNGAETDRRIRAVYTYYAGRHGLPDRPQYSSGWRPQMINEVTSNAGKKSTHLEANGGDVRCPPDGHFAWWCFRNLWILEQHALWMEHPVATVVRPLKSGGTPWCHLQRVPPRSGARCYFPDNGSITEWAAYKGEHKLA